MLGSALIVAATAAATAGALSKDIVRTDDGIQFGRVCSLAGCSTGLSVQTDQVRRKLPGARTVQICALDECREVSVVHDGMHMPCAGIDEETVIAVTATIRTESGRVLFADSALVALTLNQPNGSECGPTCYQGAAHIDAGRELLKPGRQIRRAL